jgi:hypothetical protein
MPKSCIRGPVDKMIGNGMADVRFSHVRPEKELVLYGFTIQRTQEAT